MGLESSLDPAYGVYHASSQGSYAWYEFAAEILRQSGLAQNLAKTGDFGDRAARPAYSVLENRALQSIGLDQMRPWQESLAACLQERQQDRERKGNRKHEDSSHSHATARFSRCDD